MFCSKKQLSVFIKTTKNTQKCFLNLKSFKLLITLFMLICLFIIIKQNTDVSLLPTVGWPAFALHDETLVNRTKNKIIRKLKGKYGFKRFLRDGYRTEVEDRNRKYYKPAEIKVN